MNINITVGSFSINIDSDDDIIKWIETRVLAKDPDFDTLIKRQTWVANQIDLTRGRLAALTHARNILGDSYGRLSTPHFTHNDIKEKCRECGKPTEWLWEYQPRCKNNEKPQCFDVFKGRIPLNPITQNELEMFFDEENN